MKLLLSHNDFLFHNFDRGFFFLILAEIGFHRIEMFRVRKSGQVKESIESQSSMQHWQESMAFVDMDPED